MKVKMYKCDNCGSIHSHKDSYNDQYCYDCIDIETGTLKQPKNPAAVALGSLGGKSKSEAKRKSSAENGKKGGRPKICVIDGCKKSRIYNAVTCEEHYRVGA